MTVNWSRGTQRAGAESTQIQAETVNQNYLVVSADDARAIMEHQQVEAIRAAFTDVAQEIGVERAGQLADRVVARLAQEGNLQAFSEPSFQALLGKSAIGAAQTSEESDYDILTNMLADRARQGDKRKRRIGLDRAIEVVEKVDLPDLKALTTIFLVGRMRPIGREARSGIDAHAPLYVPMVGSDELPNGSNFIDRLDLLNLVRVNPLGGFNKWDDFWMRSVSGWAAAGIRKDDPNVDEIWRGFDRRGFAPTLMEHDLDSERFRLGYANPSLLRDEIRRQGQHTDIQIERIIEYAAQWFGLNETGTPEFRAQISEAIDNTASLSYVRRWWDELPISCHITDAGVILARAYVEYCGVDSRISNWDAIDIPD